MTVTLYLIPELQINKLQTIKFASSTQRDNYFAAISKKLTPNYVGDTYDIDLLENDITVKLSDKDYNYCVITQDSTQKHYYYIVGSSQLGSGQISFRLYKDTFMTYMSVDNIGFYLGWKPSLVVREHKPRFNFTDSKILYNEFLESNNNTTPKIISETAYTTGKRVRFVYKNRTTDWRPSAYVYTDTAQSVSWTGDNWVSVLSPGEVINFYAWSGDYLYTTNINGTPNVSGTDTWSTYYHKLTTDGSFVYITRVNKTNPIGDQSVVTTFPLGTKIKISIGTQTTHYVYFITEFPLATWTQIQASNDALNNVASGSGNLPLFSAIDIYDANNEKIVELPYFDDTMTFRKDGYGVYVDLTEINEVTINPTTAIRVKATTGAFDISKTDKNRVSYNDPKLFTSQFAPIFISINGCVVDVKREWYNKGVGLNNSNSNTASINLATSILQPSLFNLKISPTGYVTKDVDELIRRFTVNNEVATIKDDAYTFNEYYRDLDDKSRKIAEDASLRNLALGSINQGAQIIGGAFGIGATTNPGIRGAQIGARAIGAAINVTQSIFEHQDYMRQNQIKYNQKYIGLELSVAQVSGSDLTFIKSYDGDRVRYHYMGLRDYDVDYWDLFFHKYGYQTLEYKIPTIKTRKYWDYKQIITDDYIQDFGLKQDCIDDLRGRFAQGITIYHCQDDLSIDWQQLKENWEV